jgi:ABC-type bacteriocin transporter
MSRRYSCVRSYEAKDCGPAALATVALHHGFYVSLNRLREMVGTDLQGTDLTSLKKAAERLGFKASSGKVKPEIFDQLPLPAIAHLSDSPQDHFVVIHKITRNRVTIADPSRGILTLKKVEFLAEWSRKILLLSPTNDLEVTERKTSATTTLMKVILDERKLVWKSVALALLVTILSLGISFFLQLIIDRVIPGSSLRLLSRLGVGVLIVLVFRSLSTFTRHYLLARLGLKIELSSTLEYVRHLLSLPISFYDRQSTGDMFSRLCEVGSIREAIIGPILSVFLDACLVVLSAGILMFYNPRLAFIIFGFMPIIAGASWMVNRPLIDRQRVMRQQFAVFAGDFVEAVGNIRIIKAFAEEDSTYTKLAEQYTRAEQTAFRRLLLSNFLVALSNLLTGAASVVVVWMGTILVVKADLTVGQLVFLYSVTGIFLAPFDSLARSINSIQQAVIATERLAEFNELTPESALAPAELAKNSTSKNLEFRSVFFSYRHGYSVLCDINFEVHLGETIAIMGETGSGKSSLAYLIAGFYAPTEGCILLDGMDIHSLNKRELRRNIGFVFQDPGLMSGTVRQNIVLGRSSATEHEVQAAAQLAKAHDFIVGLPRAYNYEVGDGGVALSTGQRQRIAIARALLRKPGILILDEATSNLDSETERAVMDALYTEYEDRTMIIVTHRLAVAMRATKILMLEKGRIVEAGSHSELTKKQGRYWALLRAQDKESSEEYIGQ